jgi:hypothetical protein
VVVGARRGATGRNKDRQADLVVWRATTGTWYWLPSSSGYNYDAQGQRQWGNQGLGDVPLLGDFDGDGVADLTVWRASTGTWYWLLSSSKYDYAAARTTQWGQRESVGCPLPRGFRWRSPGGSVGLASEYQRLVLADVRRWIARRR